MRTLADLERLQEWLTSHEEGVFVLDVAISQKVVAEWIKESVAAKDKGHHKPAGCRPLTLTEATAPSNVPPPFPIPQAGPPYQPVSCLGGPACR